MMNTYANGTCALQFPSNYVVLNEEEMEYVEGGAVSNGDYRKAQSNAWNATRAKQTKEERDRDDRAAYDYQASYCLVALSGVDAVLNGISSLGKAILGAGVLKDMANLTYTEK